MASFLQRLDRGIPFVNFVENAEVGQIFRLQLLMRRRAFLFRS